MSRDDHAAFSALLVHHVAQQLQSEAIRQPHVRDDGIKGVVLQKLACLGQVSCGFNPVAFAQQCQLIQGAQVRLIVNHQNVSGWWP